MSGATPEGVRPARLAAIALERFGVRPSRVRLLSNETNRLYRVDCDPAIGAGPGGSAEAATLVLRLARPAWRTVDDLESEALWLDAIARDTDLGAPLAVRAPDGRAVIRLPARDGASVRTATLMTWVPGRLLGAYLSERNLARMGELFARLHEHAAGWSPPAGFSRRVFDRCLSRDEPNVMFQPEQTDALSHARARLLERLASRVDAGYAALDRDDLRVIHCDLWHGNIKLHAGRLRPFDFEDTVRGFRIHDIAMAMLDLLETVGAARYAELVPAFRAGYESVLGWPDGEVALFQVGRLLWRINYVARFERRWFSQMVERCAPALERFERTGALEAR